MDNQEIFNQIRELQKQRTLLSASLSHSIKYWDEMRKMMYGKLTSFLIIEKNHNILFGVSDVVVSIVFLTKVMNIF